MTSGVATLASTLDVGHQTHLAPAIRVAIALYRSRPDATIKSVAGDLGINHETLRNWIRTDNAQHTGSPVMTGTTAVVASMPASPESENTTLCKRIREMEEERDILRKAAKYFAGETRW
ncbi:MAG TPA: transposase [Umezawaea sp.]|nr:transposase [Umezawaea sp.]